MADQVVIAAIFKSDAIPANERLDLDAVAAQVRSLGHSARVIADADSIIATAAPEMRSGDVVAILSNGGFGGIYEKLPGRLKLIAANASAASTAGPSREAWLKT
jgi:UDP-N-acetylmuramate: L-alanyl-gamma-D-glutamyl-meso-diaminopimelate ligase